ncbi:MAG: RICIN domain-containing protein, partial [Campylobacter sp.]|nr:RICIN domain-containing protein [Campylobacter sp.]
MGDLVKLKNISFKKIILFFAVVLFFSVHFCSAKANQNCLEDGFYKFESMVGKDKYVDIYDASSEKMANVQLWEKNDTLAQLFYVKKVQNEFYEIRSVCSNMALDAEGAVAQSGTNVWQFTPNSSDAQMWKFDHCYGGVFIIKSKLGNFCLDVAGGKNDSGTNIQIWDINYTNAQLFKPVKVDIDDIGLNRLTYPKIIPDYSQRFLRLRDYFFKYYTSKPYKNILVLGNDKFLKAFEEVFKNQNNFKFDL